MDLTDELTVFLHETACTLKGSARRVFMARAVRDLGAGNDWPSGSWGGAGCWCAKGGTS